MVSPSSIHCRLLWFRDYRATASFFSVVNVTESRSQSAFVANVFTLFTCTLRHTKIYLHYPNVHLYTEICTCVHMYTQTCTHVCMYTLTYMANSTFWLLYYIITIKIIKIMYYNFYDTIWRFYWYFIHVHMYTITCMTN